VPSFMSAGGTLSTGSSAVRGVRSEVSNAVDCHRSAAFVARGSILVVDAGFIAWGAGSKKTRKTRHDLARRPFCGPR
jgi:hypothetical protein